METRQLVPEVSLENAINVVNDNRRWCILNVLFDCEAIASVDLAARVGTSASNLNKHLEVLRTAGLIEQRYGRTYSLKQQFKVPGTRSIQLGPLTVHLDVLNRK